MFRMNEIVRPLRIFRRMHMVHVAKCAFDECAIHTKIKADFGVPKNTLRVQMCTDLLSLSQNSLFNTLNRDLSEYLYINKQTNNQYHIRSTGRWFGN